MWTVNGNNIKMAEHDYGVALTVTVGGMTLSGLEKLKFTFKKSINGMTILSKEYIPMWNRVEFIFTEAESEMFPVGDYVYAVDLYKDDVFMYNIVPYASFKVVDKVG